VQQCAARFLWADFFGEKEVVMVATPPPPPVWSSAQDIVPLSPGHPAGFWIRFVAYVIDMLILGVGALIIFGIVFALLALSGAELESGLTVIIGLVLGIVPMIVIGWLYEALLTSGPHGATLGKRAVGVQIVRADGTQLSFGRATARYFLKAMITPMVPFAIGYLLAAFTAGKRSLHDFMADTLVIYPR
jgi:uncharacterized RDD family membrane protein YckC